MNSAVNRATRLSKAATNTILNNEQEIANNTIDYLKTTNEAII